MQRSEKTEESLRKKKVCCFCNTDEIDELRLGPIKSRNDVSVHYYCLLLASNFVVQLGKDNEGIAGFLLPDIRKEVKKCKPNVCHYCRKTGASIFCHRANCRIIFHLPCGLEAGSLSRFDTFQSYCHKHRPYQKVAQHMKDTQLTTTWTCLICFEPISPTDLKNTLWGPCCKNAFGYHRHCVQTLALNSGYLFRCPLCNDIYKFRSEMMSQGIYIPMQDASWELEANAYQDQQVRYSKCDALECCCRFGREFKRRGSRWDVVLCKYCGSQGVHLACGFLNDKSDSWECKTCRGVARVSRQSEVQRKYGSRYICKSEDVAMVQRMSANWREEIYSRTRRPSRRITEVDTLRGRNANYRVTIHPDLLLNPRAAYRSSTGSMSQHLDKTICSNHDSYLIVDADRASVKSPPVNYLNVIRKRHLIEHTGRKSQKKAKAVEKETVKHQFHLRYRHTYPVDKNLNPL